MGYKPYDPSLVRVEIDKHGQIVIRRNMYSINNCYILEPVKVEVPLTQISDVISTDELLNIEKTYSLKNNYKTPISNKISSPKNHNNLRFYLSVIIYYDEYFKNLLQNINSYVK